MKQRKKNETENMKMEKIRNCYILAETGYDDDIQADVDLGNRMA